MPGSNGWRPQWVTAASAPCMSSGSPPRDGGCIMCDAATVCGPVVTATSDLLVLCYVADFACHDIRRRIPSLPRTHDALDRGSMDFDPDSGYLTKHYYFPDDLRQAARYDCIWNGSHKWHKWYDCAHQARSRG